MKDILTNATDLVRQFHVTFDHPVAYSPTLIPFDRVQVRADWLNEEVDELIDPAKQTVEDQVDATMDIIYFAIGNLVELGVDPTPLFQIVQDANMGKVWPDGTVHKNEKGKTLKPKGWEAPEPKLRAEIARQLAHATGNLPKHAEFFTARQRRTAGQVTEASPPQDDEEVFELAPVNDPVFSEALHDGIVPIITVDGQQ